MPPDELTLEAPGDAGKSARAKSRWATIPSGKPVYLKVGRFGPYVQRGSADDEEKPQNASLLKGMKPEDVTLERGAETAHAAADAGHASPERPAGHGLQRQFGPYVKCGEETETRSLPAGLSPLDVTFEQAMELLAQPKAAAAAAADARSR